MTLHTVNNNFTPQFSMYEAESESWYLQTNARKLSRSPTLRMWNHHQQSLNQKINFDTYVDCIKSTQWQKRRLTQVVKIIVIKIICSRSDSKLLLQDKFFNSQPKWQLRSNDSTNPLHSESKIIRSDCRWKFPVARENSYKKYLFHQLWTLSATAT